MMIKIFFFLSFLQLSLWGTTFSECKHLLNRTMFGIDNIHLNLCLQSKSYEDFIDTIIYHAPRVRTADSSVYMPSILRPSRKIRDLNITERKAFQKKKRESFLTIKEWWFTKMLTTQIPFEERMVLFWHNHFTSSLRKVGQSALIYQQNKLFRKHALGNFSELLHAMIEDPAMLIYLDNRANKKSHPNENFARELLELFTLGEGNYSEDDVKEFARALTGYSVDKDLKFRFKKKIHDNNNKQLFGQTGNFNAHDVVDIILQQKETSVFIVKKLWLAFIGEHPHIEEVQRLAKIFRQNNYNLKPLMQALLTSSYFTDIQTRGTMIKSPIELIVGTLRSFGYRDFDNKLAIQFSRRLNQDLFDPPNVKGWNGGKSWINTNTFLIRRSFLNRLTRGDTMNHLHYDLFTPRTEVQSKEERAAEILLPIKVYITPASQFDQTLRTILQHPLYQLK